MNEKDMIEIWVAISGIIEILKAHKLTTNEEFDNTVNKIKQACPFKTAYEKIDELENNPMLNIFNEMIKK